MLINVEGRSRGSKFNNIVAITKHKICGLKIKYCANGRSFQGNVTQINICFDLTGSETLFGE